MKLRVKSFVYGLLSSFGFLCFLMLLPDTKVLEDIAQYFVGGDLTGDAADVVEYFADVLGQEVAGDAVLEAFFYALEADEGLAEGFVVAGVGDNYFVVVDGLEIDAFKQFTGELVEVVAVLGRNGYDVVAAAEFAESGFGEFGFEGFGIAEVGFVDDYKELLALGIGFLPNVTYGFVNFIFGVVYVDQQ